MMFKSQKPTDPSNISDSAVDGLQQWFFLFLFFYSCQNEMLAKDTCKFVQVISAILKFLYNMRLCSDCMFIRLHLCLGVEGMVVELHMGNKADQPVTTAHDYVSTFVSVTLLNIFKESSGHFPSQVCTDKKLVFSTRHQDISSWLCGNKTRYFKPMQDIFLTLTE